jgi:hypothetical protein
MSKNGADVVAASAAITVDGTSEGFVTVADPTVFFVGAQAWLVKAATESIEVKIVAVNFVGTIGLRLVNRVAAGEARHLEQTSYGQSDMSAYLVLDGWYLFQPAQFIWDTTLPVAPN